MARLPCAPLGPLGPLNDSAETPTLVLPCQVFQPCPSAMPIEGHDTLGKTGTKQKPVQTATNLSHDTYLLFL